MRKRKATSPASLAKNRRPQLKLIVKIATVVLALAAALWYAGSALQKLRYFNIKDIYVREDSARWSPVSSAASSGVERVDLSYLFGKNIFALDLQKEALYIAEAYPDYRKVRLIKVLPNRLLVDCARRQPLACVRLYRDFWVDENLYLFDMPKEFRGAAELPVIAGLATKIAGPKSGRRYAVRELSLGVDIIKEARLTKGLEGYTIQKIDVANPDTASFLLRKAQASQPTLKNAAEPFTAADFVEIKIGASNIKAKLKLLNELLGQLKEKNSAMQYIDLRFKEPVIKLRDAK